MLWILTRSVFHVTCTFFIPWSISEKINKIRLTVGEAWFIFCQNEPKLNTVHKIYCSTHCRKYDLYILKHERTSNSSPLCVNFMHFLQISYEELQRKRWTRDAEMKYREILTSTLDGHGVVSFTLWQSLTALFLVFFISLTLSFRALTLFFLWQLTSADTAL
jgi:hypothetical protein